MSEDIRIPIIEEEALVSKRKTETERVTVHTSLAEEQVIVRDELRHEHVEVSRIRVDREVAEAPSIRTEGDFTIVPVLEERLVVEKRLFVVEELHLRRTATIDPVEVPTTLRRTHVEVNRQQPDQGKEI